VNSGKLMRGIDRWVVGSDSTEGIRLEVVDVDGRCIASGDE
jgi:hypothetical protein